MWPRSQGLWGGNVLRFLSGFAWTALAVMRSAAESSKWGVWGSTALIPHIPRGILAGEISCDVAIVGGGFAGLSTAIHLAEGGASVSVLEAVEIGHGASGRNGGQVNAGLRASLIDLGRRYGEAGRRLYRMAQEAPDYLAELVVRLNIQAGFVRRGGFKLAHSAPTARLLESAVSELQREGVEAEFLSRDELASRVGSRRYQAGMFDPRSAAVHPLDLAREYSRVASGLGVLIYENSWASSLIKSGAQWQVKTPSGAVNAERVVVATNAYTDDLIAGLRQSILPVNLVPKS
jgi:glycine/D-amino acid oxidase-like deaminating enzyme